MARGAEIVERILPVRTKILFGLGWPVEYIVLRSLELFVLFYYTQVLGLKGTLAGLALFVAMLVDAFADPAIGHLSDHLRKSKLGRRHTFMFLAPIPLGLALIAIFNPPGGMEQTGMFLWLTGFTVALRVLCGLYVVPYSAQLAELTKAPEERASLQLYKSVTQTVFDSLVLALAFNFFFVKNDDGSGGQTDASVYLGFSIALASLLVVSTLASAFGTWRRMREIEASIPDDEEDAKTQARHSGTGSSVLAAVLSSWRAALFGNPNIRAIVLGALLTALATSIMRSLASHMGTYFWGLEAEQIGYWQQAAIPGFFVGMFLARFLAKRVELIRMLLVSVAVITVAVIALPSFWLAFPSADNDLIFRLLLLSSFGVGLGSGVLMLVAGLVCAEAADEEEFINRISRQGFIFGFVFLATKIGSALGKLFSGFALDAIALPASVTDLTGQEDALALFMVVAVGVTGAVSYYFWSRFDLTRERHAHIRAELQARRDAVASS